ncbi:MAG: DUF2993 domain-containing protein [Halanaerobium sp.]|nr:DUF2993 domain-containing protein [Halanaerobium sp.]
MGDRSIRFWVRLIAGFIILGLILQFALPRYFTRKVTDYLYTAVEDVDILTVSLHSFPALQLFLGRVDRASIYFTKLEVDDLQLAEGRLVFTDLALGKTTEGYAFISGENPYLDLEISEAALNEYIQRQYEIPSARIDLKPGKVDLAVTINWFGKAVDLSLQGSLVVESPTRVQFVGRAFNIEGKEIPDIIWNQLEGQVKFALDFSSLPFPLEIKQVAIGEDGLHLRGENEDI